MDSMNDYPDGFQTVINSEGAALKHLNYTDVIGRGETMAQAFADWLRQVEAAQTWAAYTGVGGTEVDALEPAPFYIPKDEWVKAFGNGIARSFARREVNPCHPAIRRFIERYFALHAAPQDAGEFMGRREYLTPWRLTFGENLLSIERDIHIESPIEAAWRKTMRGG